MLINSPSNPTGQVYNQALTEETARFCRKRSRILINNEIYSGLCFDAKESSIQLPLLDHAIKALQKAITKLKVYSISKQEMLLVASERIL